MADERLNAELNKLRSRGLILPRHPGRAAQSYGEAVSTTRSLHQAAGRDLDNLSLRVGRTITSDNYDSPEIQRIMQENKAMIGAMGSKRATSRRMQKQAGLGGTGFGGDVMNAIPRFYDPLEYWDLSGLPWNVADEGHRHKLHKWLRLYYATHYLVPILVDIFTRFPLVGMELECKDTMLKDIYEDMFFDTLKYGDFFVSLGREFWCVGEAFPLGSFDEDLGIWEHEELINPEDVVIDNFPMLDSQQLKIVPPDYLRRLAQLKSPAREYYLLQQNYPELIPYLLKGEHIPISPVLIRQVANKHNDWDDHGTPILLRGLRTLLHEEKLMASQDAIAERLYSPFILAKLGIMDMGDGLPPWIPGIDELESVRDDIDEAMASDFRVMVHHFGLEMTSVFGREQMPRLGDDFDRIERRLMQVFGVNPSLLSAGSNSQPYASSALQAEFMNQILRTFQQMLKDHFRERALVVAEAQGHYDYERKGQTRVPVYETIVEFDEEGNKTLREVPKLLVPDLTFSTFDLRDEATERQFLMGLRQMGVPIPDDKLMVGITWKLKDVIDEYNQELKEKTISQQQAKMDTYVALTIKGLPVPLDLKAECESVLQQSGQGAAPGGAPGGSPGGAPAGGMPGGDPMGGAPPGGGSGGGIVMPPPPPGLGAGPGTAPPGGGPPAMTPMSGGPAGSVPQVSNERRPGLTYNTHLKDLKEKLAGFSLDHIASHDEIDILSAQLGWTDGLTTRAHEIRDEFLAAEVSTKDDECDTLPSVEDESDQELTLKRNQTLKRDDDNREIILEKKAKRVVIKVPEGKKYAIVDPLEPELTSDEEEPSDINESETE